MTFLRTVEEGPTDRSYGVHVADLAGVPDPVVDRARDVLDRLRSDRAIEARGSGGGEPVQAVFDLGSGEFRRGDEGERGAVPETTASDGGDAGLDPEAAAVLEELRKADVEATAPVELLATVQEWQRRLEE